MASLEPWISFTLTVAIRSVATAAASERTVTVSAAVGHGQSDRWSWTGSHCWITAKHGDAGPVLGATQRDHVLADVGCDNLTTLRIRVGQDVLDQVVAKLVARDYRKC